ncbi:MAG TPA: helix-turn-helix transcriptional regulator [Thermoanaerobaculia bacterium]|nr:helix-turn-helix transcriptional regulator [Thermoanaerobaculia bacterium]
MKNSMRLLGMTNRDIERQKGWSSSYLSRLFSGAIELKYEHILDICEVMGLEPAEFFQMAYGSPDQAPPSEAALKLRKSIQIFMPARTGAAPAPPAAQAAEGSTEPRQEKEIDEELMERMLAKTLRRLLQDTQKAGE